MPRSLEVLTSSYGEEAELHSLIQALHEANIRVLADIVVNHRCAAAKVKSYLRLCRHFTSPVLGLMPCKVVSALCNGKTCK